MGVISPAPPFDRRLVLPGAISAAAVLVIDGIWLALASPDNRPLGFSVAAVLTVVLGAVIAARLPGRPGWTALVAGGAIGSLIATGIYVVATLSDAWGIVGAISLLVSDGLFGVPLATLGFGYWIVTRTAFSGRMPGSRLPVLQTAGLLIAAVAVIVAATVLIRPAPRGTFVWNNTTVLLRFYEDVDGNWHQLGRGFDLFTAAGVTGRFIDSRDPNMTTAPGGLDSRGCTTRQIVARDPNGKDVASHAPGLCDGETWVISMPAPSP